DVLPSVAEVQLPAVEQQQPEQLVDLKAWRTPVVDSDPAQRERERVLEPGASGSVAGSYKMLRTQVLNRMEQLGTNTLAVVSASERDGKTLTAINLGISIAADPARTTLLVDLDLRRPSIHRKLGIEARSGVERCLRGELAVEAALLRPRGFER